MKKIVKQVNINDKRLERIMREFKTGFAMVGKVKKAVSFFGSKRLSPSNKYYKAAFELAKTLAEDGFSIVTGGGPGIMEAANKGAYRAKGTGRGQSIGMSITIAEEEKQNKFVKKGHSFHYFFTRKVMLSAPAQAYVFLPGGYGTMDEFFELIVLIQTKKTRAIPVILYGKEFWQPLYNYLNTHLYKRWRVIDKKDLKFLTIVDSVSEAAEIIKSSAERDSLV